MALNCSWMAIQALTQNVFSRFLHSLTNQCPLGCNESRKRETTEEDTGEIQEATVSSIGRDHCTNNLCITTDKMTCDLINENREKNLDSTRGDFFF